MDELERQTLRADGWEGEVRRLSEWFAKSDCPARLHLFEDCITGAIRHIEHGIDEERLARENMAALRTWISENKFDCSVLTNKDVIRVIIGSLNGAKPPEVVWLGSSTARPVSPTSPKEMMALIRIDASKWSLLKEIGVGEKTLLECVNQARSTQRSSLFNYYVADKDRELVDVMSAAGGYCEFVPDGKQVRVRLSTDRHSNVIISGSPDDVYREVTIGKMTLQQCLERMERTEEIHGFNSYI